MPNPDWSIPHTLFTPYGELPLNEQEPTTGGFLVLDETKCSAAPPLRTGGVPASQEDGFIPSRSFKSGYEIRLGLKFTDENREFACDGLLRALDDLLMAHLDSLLRPEEADLGAGNARLLWTPPDFGTV